MPTAVGMLVREAVIRYGDKTALVFEEQRRSFRGLTKLPPRWPRNCNDAVSGTGGHQ